MYSINFYRTFTEIAIASVVAGILSVCETPQGYVDYKEYQRRSFIKVEVTKKNFKALDEIH